MLGPAVLGRLQPSPPPLVLVLGGQRSGKSAWAERRVLATGLEPVYVATATAGDGEMAARIAQHQARRGDRWRLIEEPLALARIIAEEARADRALLVDCLTLWLTNLLLAEADVAAADTGLLATLAQRPGPVVLVSNEVGSGVVPMGELSRRFVDAAGRLHQGIAARATEVVLVSAGLAQVLRGPTLDD